MDKVVLITGAGRGFGLALAGEFHNHGYTTVGTRRGGTNPSPVLDIVWEYAEMEQAENLKAMCDRVVKEQGRVDVLINNAGIYLDDPRKKDVSLLSLDSDLLEKTLKVNYMAAFTYLSAVLPVMLQHGYGRIINISSGMGRLDQFDGYSYAYRASKLMMNTLTISYGRVLEGLDADVAIASVCPGWMRTDMGTEKGIVSPEFSAMQTYRLLGKTKAELNGKFFRDGQELNYSSKQG